MSDGSEAGTYRLTDINPGAKDSAPTSIEAYDRSIVFSAFDDEHGRELWRLDTENQAIKTRKKTSNQKVDSSDSSPLSRIVPAQRGRGSLKGSDYSDEFLFNKRNQFGTKKADTIINFDAKSGDELQLDRSVFKGLDSIRLATVSSLSDFNRMLESKSNFIYYQPSGELYFDQNGSKPGLGPKSQSGLFAIFESSPDLNRADILIL